ncbi:hypothetical protein ESY86_01640 [Subsaximicrobium wynnwilliamsii]|jgi:hypothetical protein|uniref:Restriction endonuclease n=1 Tax=Subsaximicrobium wynnwilliamsii TaxID=291179 RepID=A0A5C6ZN25_9FLAO|nr:hypothetical protein [Subsaximicrobium wynnwilliamsii]TXD85270.1 hypothetical protein ESY87_02810 [Subsaximicrobium wynnwilliamsii]TXD91312.1 hypothetical protein ESY86_01640 [Subsaximicrobium wynnwilliamsii]TXE04706.1 hypothetical protein ESY88_04290 [Subsaximicrobium wynnwilliamsii]
MIKIKVSEQDKLFAKQQIEAFQKIDAGSWRYANVEAWRGIVCELLASQWFEQHFKIDKPAKGLDNSGIVDDCDMIINAKKIEIKSATKNFFRYLMPKIHDVRNHPKDIYIGVKYNETVEPNEIQILGHIKRAQILEFPIKKNKGAPYYEVPLSQLAPIDQHTFD